MRIRKKRVAACCSGLAVLLLALPHMFFALLSLATPGDHTCRARCERYQWAWDIEYRWDGCCRTQGWQAAGYGQLKTTAGAQALLRGRTGRYARTYQELIAAGLLRDYAYSGYRIAIVSDGATWSATSVPACPVCTVGWGRSFFVDQTGAFRVAERGQPAPTAKSPPL